MNSNKNYTINIQDFSNEENRLVLAASSEYGDIYDNASRALDLFWSFVSSIKQKYWLSFSVLAQVKKQLTLALLATIRRHQIQAKINMRYAIEAAAYSAFAIHNPDEKIFIKNKDNKLIENPGIKKKIYTWMDKEFPDLSKKLLYKKETINSYFSHANIIIIAKQFEINTDGINNNFFDKNDKPIENVWIWEITDLTILFIHLFANLISNYSAASLSENMSSELAIIETKHYEIKEKLKNNPRFRRLTNK